QPALGHGRVLLGVQVTGDRFVILPALHISGHVYGLNEPTDALSHQLHGEHAGVVVAGRSDGAGGNELPDRASREDAASGLQPFVAALFQVLVDLEAHLSRLLHQVFGYGVLVPAGDPVALGAAGVDAFAAVHSVLECADVAAWAVAGHSITPISASSSDLIQSRTAPVMIQAARAAVMSRRRVMGSPCRGEFGRRNRTASAPASVRARILALHRQIRSRAGSRGR